MGSSTMHRSVLAAWLILVAALAMFAPSARADVSYPPRPDPHEHVSDGAALISPADRQAINTVAEKLLKDEDVPIIVATIDSLARYGAAGWPIERYAMNLFDEWGIGREARNYGVLLLVPKGDRKARIELGRGFSHRRDERTGEIMTRTIIPRFKQGDFSGGIAAGVRALDEMARQENIPLPSRANAPGAAPAKSSPSAPAAAPSRGASSGRTVSWLGPLVCIGVAVVGLILISSMARRATRGVLGGGYGGYSGYGGRGMGWGSGWGSAMPPWWWWIPDPGTRGGGLFGRSDDSSGSGRSSHSGSGGFGGFGGFGGGGGGGGGSFGGGFSGGGGSTGSW